MQFFHKSRNSRHQKQKPLEAEVFGSRRLKLQSIDGLFESTKFEKLKEAISLSRCKRNILII